MNRSMELNIWTVLLIGGPVALLMYVWAPNREADRQDERRNREANERANRQVASEVSELLEAAGQGGGLEYTRRGKSRRPRR